MNTKLNQCSAVLRIKYISKQYEVLNIRPKAQQLLHSTHSRSEGEKTSALWRHIKYTYTYTATVL